MAINYGKIFEGKKRKGNRGGRPPFQPTQSDRRTVSYLVAAGATLSDIADCIGEDGIDITTLHKHFEKELRTSRQLVTMLAMGSLIGAIKNQEPWAVQLYLRCKAGFKETSAHQLVDQQGQDRGLNLGELRETMLNALEGQSDDVRNSVARKMLDMHRQKATVIDVPGQQPNGQPH